MRHENANTSLDHVIDMHAMETAFGICREIMVISEVCSVQKPLLVCYFISGIGPDVQSWVSYGDSMHEIP